MIFFLLCLEHLESNSICFHVYSAFYELPPITVSPAFLPPLHSSIHTMSGCLQAVVEQGPNLPPQFPLLVVCRGHVDEQLALQQHVDVSSLQTTPAALRLACDLVVLRRQVIQHRALVSPPRLQLNSEANKVTGETCDLNLEEGDEGEKVCMSKYVTKGLIHISAEGFSVVTLNLSLTAEPAGFCDIKIGSQSWSSIQLFSSFSENVSVRYVVDWFIII